MLLIKHITIFIGLHYSMIIYRFIQLLCVNVVSLCTMIMVQMDDFAGFRPYAPSFQIRDFYGQKRKTRNLTFVLKIQDNYIINQAYHNLYLFYNFCIKF